VTQALLNTLRLARDPARFLGDLRARQGHAASTELWPVGHLLVLSDPQALAELFAADTDLLRAGAATERVMPLLRGSVLCADGADHHARRRLLLPVFRTSSVAALADEVEQKTLRALATLPSGSPVEMLPIFRRLTFGLLSRVVLGTDEPARAAAIAHALDRFITGRPVLATWPTALRPLLLPALLRRRAELDALVRAELERGPGEGSAAAALLATQLPEDQLLAELRALLIVGHETTASALAWGTELLARHPRKARQLADRDAAYASAVARETLRLRPSVIDAVRLAAAPISLAGREFQAGTLLMAAPLLVHLDPDMHDRPHEFRPERFLDNAPAPGSFIPFGGGSRHCLGAPLAMLQLRTVLPTIVRARRLGAATPVPEHARLRGTALIPAAGAPVVLLPAEQRQMSFEPGKTGTPPSSSGTTSTR
jgi:cytochrome P450